MAGHRDVDRHGVARGDRERRRQLAIPRVVDRGGVDDVMGRHTGTVRTVLDVHTLTDGGQTAEDMAARVVSWLAEARESLDLALYDVRLPGAPGDAVADAIRAAHARGVRVRIAFNQDERPPDDEPRPFFPAPPATEPHVLETLGVPGQADPRLARPDAPQVRRPRRRPRSGAAR